MTKPASEIIRPDPLTERMGVVSRMDESGACVSTLECGADHCNIFGVVHGVVLFAMADVGMGSALTWALPDARRVGSVSITANYVRAAKPGLLTAVSRLVRLGRSMAFLETQIRDADEAVCARFSGVFFIAPDTEPATS